MAEDRAQFVPLTPYDVFRVIRESYALVALTGDADLAQRHQAEAYEAMARWLGSEEEAALLWASGMGLWQDHNARDGGT